MDLVVATVSGYHGSERFKLIKLISQAGASYVGAMNSSTTHLVSRKFEGKKYELAQKFKTIVVNHRWIEDCIKQGKRVSERPYMKHCGFEVGPLLLEMPNDANEANTRNLSKTPVIDVDDNDEEWVDSWLLKEKVLPDIKHNKDHSNRLKRKKDTKRCLRRDVLLTNEYCSEESLSFGVKRTESEDLISPSSSHHMDPKRKVTTIREPSERSRRLIHKNICNDLTSSSYSEEILQSSEIHHNNIDVCEPSDYSGKHETRRPHKTRLHDHRKRRTLILEEMEDLGTSCNNEDDAAGIDGDYNKMEHSPGLSKQVLLSCVICWTDFSPTRGVLPCGHRFCFSCIQNWADHMASMNKVSTCPLCKASFYSIQKMEDAEYSDQKIYSQTIPNDYLVTDVCILPHGESSTHQTLPPPRPVCHQCSCYEPAELLIKCYSCQIYCIHSYCLDPPQIPWVCVQCKHLRMRYAR